MTTTEADPRTGMWFAQAFPGSPEQAGNVRRAIRSYLGLCPASDDVTLIASELATNAIVHSRSGHDGMFTVRAELHPTWVWIEVEDAGGEWTDPGHDDRPHGLAIVNELAREWGRSNHPHGRTVWARVDFQAPRSGVQVLRAGGAPAAVPCGGRGTRQAGTSHGGPWDRTKDRDRCSRPEEASMAEVADCVERMIQFRQRCPGAEFDLKPNMFTARVPGHDEPFRAMSLCNLMNAVERWAAEETMARLLFGPEPAERQDHDR